MQRTIHLPPSALRPEVRATVEAAQELRRLARRTQEVSRDLCERSRELRQQLYRTVEPGDRRAGFDPRPEG